MTKRTDGGPAFPQISNGQGYPDYETGLSIRDWFAGQALVGLLSGQYNHTGSMNLSGVPEEAYKIADAMLAARAAKETSHDTEHRV
jgi:hypothetical protein